MSRRRPIKNRKDSLGRIWRQLLLLILIFLVVPVGLYFLVKTYTPVVVKNYHQFMKREGLTVQTILVEGRAYTAKQDLTKCTQRFKGQIMGDVTVEALESELKKLPWVNHVVIRKQWPDTLTVRLIEHVPIARWQVNQKLKLLTGAGHAFEVDNISSFSHLPYILGEGADKVVGDLLTELKKYPTIYRSFVSAVWVGKRRWNLNLSDGLTVRLREQEEEKDLVKLNKYLKDKVFMAQQPEVIDFRVPSKTIIKKKKKKK